MTDEDREAAHQDHILRSFNAYRYQHLSGNNLRRQALAALPAAQQALLPDQSALLTALDHCIVANAEFLEDVAEAAKAGPLHTACGDGHSHSSPTGHAAHTVKPKITDNEMEKLRSTLRQIHRDWSEEGRTERDKAYLPILEALERHFGTSNRSDVRVLVPGCGLGRLPFEIARRGFSAQGNEFSLFMLFTSAYILNSSSAANEFLIYPFCHSLSNIRTLEGATRRIPVPDVAPADELLKGGGSMSMAAGDWLDIYRDEAGQWDALVTCFFIDTAHNVIDYLERIRKLLKPGGVWINLGPSLWHFEGNASGSIDLPLSEIKKLATRMGFKLQNEIDDLEMAYTANPESTMRYTYFSSFWTATI